MGWWPLTDFNPDTLAQARGSDIDQAGSYVFHEHVTWEGYEMHVVYTRAHVHVVSGRACLYTGGRLLYIHV